MSPKSPKDYDFRLVNRKEISSFIEKNHYSGNINGCIADYCFAIYYGSDMVGAMFFGKMAMANQWKRFGEQEKDVIELRRLCCIDDTPRNTESWFIGKALRWLKKNTGLKVVVSYADAEYGHAGTIYKASNFEYEGFRKGAKVIMFNGKRYHDKAIRTKYKGELKPFAVRLVNALAEGLATYQTTAGKHCYVYKL
ncbi:hypothetical protein PHYNN_167 [Pantoea phage Phynn]|nr:hypothetical protein PHYNN_167 [Pantoea phage Phynn]